jgi:hypothetical protein
MAIPPPPTGKPTANTILLPSGDHLACCTLVANGVIGVAAKVPTESPGWMKIR